MNALSLQHLALGYDLPEGRRLTVLDIDDFTLESGSQTALTGPSGCGKSTLLHVLSGIVRPDRGTLLWHGTDITTLSGVAADRWRWLNLGLMFQQFHLFGHLSALDNVLLPLGFGPLPDKARHRAHGSALLDRVGIRPDQRTGLLSRGQMQRVAMARALVLQPPVVLADEPTASLDREHATVAMDLLTGLCRDAGSTLIVATHDLALADRLDRRLTLTEGHLS